MKRTAFVCLVVSLSILSCQKTESENARQQQSADPASASPQDTQANPSTDNATTTIPLPSQKNRKTNGFKMPEGRPDEVCMEKGWNWLYQGYLQPECGTCHYQQNRYGVTPFADGKDKQSSFETLRVTTDHAKVLDAVLGNVFCTGCVIEKQDPLYQDLSYFLEHMDRCEKTGA